jgi:hypothetical protein
MSTAQVGGLCPPSFSSALRPFSLLFTLFTFFSFIRVIRAIRGELLLWLTADSFFVRSQRLRRALFFLLRTKHSALSTKHFFSPPLQIVQNVFFAPGGVKNAVSSLSKTCKLYILYNQELLYNFKV